MPPLPRTAAIPASARHSPCVGICDLDAATGWCRGCGRSRDEIAVWISMSDAERLAVWDGLGARLDALDVPFRLMPWTVQEIAAWMRETLARGGGTWSIDVAEAVVAFAPSGPPAITVGDGTIVARSDSAAMRVRLHEKVRAFAFGRGGDGPLALALPKARVAFRPAAGLHHAGLDVHAIDPAQRTHDLFDLGVASEWSRACLRTSDDELIGKLHALANAPLPRVLQEVGALIAAKNPLRVVETALARIEVQSALAGANGHETAQIERLSQLLQPRDETRTELALPSFVLPVLNFHP